MRRLRAVFQVKVASDAAAAAHSCSLLISALAACTSSAPTDERDCARCPEMVVIPAGTAILGASSTGDEPAQGCPFANGFDQTTMATYKGVDASRHTTFDPLSCTDGGLSTIPVGSLQPNAFGVHDMIGNVSEWIEDCHAPSHAAVSDSGAPPEVEGTCAKRIAKGGSWGTLAKNLRTAERFPYAPGHRDDSIGIRVAKTLR